MCRMFREGYEVTRPIWAPWRLEYISDAGTQEGCLFCAEAAGELGDESLVVMRGERAFVLLNKFPYSSGHVMVAPVRHVAELGNLEPADVAELHVLTTRSIDALRRVYSPDAFNVGWNLGEVAGGSISGHLHEHVVPRWAGDTNFMPVLADIKVIPEHLTATRERLRGELA
jgi:ATP adenylyltransferase